jgi:carbon-monoxide dehydrogenase small subunit
MSHDPQVELALTVNGEPVERTTSGRRLLSDFLRHELGLTGTHVGCEHGVCGACTVLVDGRTARSCLTLAAQVHGAEVVTVEGLTPEDGLSLLQECFRETHALQCGFCTPGFLAAAHELLEDHPDRTEFTDEEARAALSGNVCRCTGYQHIIEAVQLAARRRHGVHA